MKCPCCGAAELIRETRDLSYPYKGKNAIIPAVTGDFCPVCGEVVLNREHGDRYSELIGQFQLQAAEIFGGGNALSRYENGKTKPPLALVKRLKVLDRHPAWLDEVRTV